MPATQIELKQANLSYGIKIDSIVPDSPAATSGLKKNDIIYKINSILIRSEIDLQRFLTHCTPDSTIEIFISQNKEFKSIIVALADRNDLHKELYIYNYIQNPWLFIGMNVEPISQGLAHLLKLETGMLILDIRENSIASFQGLEAGDIIISINDMPTVNENSLTKAMNLGLQNQPMKFYLWRNSEKFTKLVSLSNRLTNDNNQNSDEIFIVGPDIYDVELYSYSKEKINILLNKPKSELEEDIERLENEIYKLRRKIGNRQ
ncbi:MAG: PDZ domain-containing protein [Candidatus Cloacimonetes bacterium]|jgi:S1-C subfamily serine protease|nr:PDZ domain-containing protein [Candidatus Cloacimonadota bacterium]